VYAKAKDLNLVLHALGGVEDHVHVVASIPPRLSVAACVKHLKGASSRAVNVQARNERVFQWQEGYGALTFGERSLHDRHLRAKQRRHHREGTALALYERTDEGDVGSRLQTTLCERSRRIPFSGGRHTTL